MIPRRHHGTDPRTRWTLLRERGVDIFRAKGVLSVRGLEEKFVFQAVHMIVDGKPAERWRDGEARSNRLVFIGKNLNRLELTSSFESCMAAVVADGTTAEASTVA